MTGPLALLLDQDDHIIGHTPVNGDEAALAWARSIYRAGDSVTWTTHDDTRHVGRLSDHGKTVGFLVIADEGVFLRTPLHRILVPSPVGGIA